MLLLAVDTSGRDGSLALAVGDAHSFELIEQAPLSSRSYSTEVIPLLSALLERHGFAKFDIEAFAVASGPGSFTGLRVGLAAVKGLAEIMGRPIAAVSVLEAIAAQSGTDGRVIAAIDAGRKEFYVGEFDLAAGLRSRRVAERLLTETQFKELIEADADAELITPELAIAELAPMHLKCKQVDWPGAGEIARLGFAKLLAGEQITAELLEANYIRRSDAEINLKPRG